MPLACAPLRQRLLDHLRRPGVAVSLSQLAAAAEESEAYVHSSAAARLLAAIGAVLLLWGRADPGSIWAGGLLRKVVGCDRSYLLVSRLVLQQQEQQQQQRQTQEEEQGARGLLPVEVWRAMAVEACSTVRGPTASCVPKR